MDCRSTAATVRHKGGSRPAIRQICCSPSTQIAFPSRPQSHSTDLPQENPTTILWIVDQSVDCWSIANTMQSSHDPDELQPNAANWSRIGPNRSRTEAHPRYQPKTLAMLAQSFAILGIVVDLVLWLLASLAQPRGLRIECKCKAIASGLRPKHRGSNLDNPIEL